MKDPRLGFESELQPLAYATAIAHQIQATSMTYAALHGHAWILNPLSKAGDQTHIIMDTGWVLNPLNHSKNSTQRYLLAVPTSPL